MYYVFIEVVGFVGVLFVMFGFFVLLIGIFVWLISFVVMFLVLCDGLCNL